MGCLGRSESKVSEGLQLEEGLPSGLDGVHFGHGGKGLHEGNVSHQHILFVP